MRARFPQWLAMIFVLVAVMPRAAWSQDLPRGVEVMTRGPIHEAFATPTAEPAPGMLVPKAPPRALEEMPPEQKPDGDVVWVSGYWAWDDDRKDYLWVSGIWRTLPPGKQWVAGYWRQAGDQWQWVGGYWSHVVQETADQEVTYYPAPPPPPTTAPIGEPPTPDSFYVPGSWVWAGDRYAWRSGYWAKVQPGYVWVPGHYRWTPSGYIYIAGYWDYAIAQRGVIFAPVVVDPAMVSVGFVYTPTFVVRDHVIIDSLFIRPSVGFYYFGDYYGPAYREWGFTSAVVYSRGYYDPIYSYARWEYRDQPSWFSLQLEVSLGRSSGSVPCPPRTLVQQNTIVNNVTNVTNVTNVANVNNTNINNTNIHNTTVNNNTMVMPASQMAAAKGGAVKVVSVPPAARAQAAQQAKAVQQVAAQRQQLEAAAPATASAKPRTSTLKVPQATPVGKPASATASTGSHPGATTNSSVSHPATSAAAGAAGHSNTATGTTGTPNGSHPATGTGPATGAGHGATAGNSTAGAGAPTGTTTSPSGTHPTTTTGATTGTTATQNGAGARPGTGTTTGTTLSHPTTVGPPPTGHPVPTNPNGRPGLNLINKPPMHSSQDNKKEKKSDNK
jgi:hypothetical protein